MSIKNYYFGILLIFVIFSFFMLWELDNVDLEATEDIYVADSVGYIRHDPFIVPRHHLRKPHYPASPHPFLFQLLQAETFKLFGISLYSARILPAISTIISLIILIWLTQIVFNSYKLSVLTGVIYSTMPIIARYGRMALIDPVLNLFVLLGMLWLWLSLKQKGWIGYLHAVFAGVSLGLCISVKLTGIFYIGPFFLIFIWQYIKKRDLYFIKTGLLCLISATLILVFLNDPYSYYYGWTHFSEQISKHKYSGINMLYVIKGIFAYRYWFLFIISIFGIPQFILLLTSILWKKNLVKKEQTIFILLWLVGPLSYLVLNPPHITGLSAEWSYFPLIPPLSIIISYSYLGICKLILKKETRYSIIFFCFGYLLLSLPQFFLYGLRFLPSPLASHLKTRNVVRGDLAVTKIITKMNMIKQPTVVLVDVKGMGFPLWLLNDNISTEPFYHELSFYAYIITDNPILIQKALALDFLLLESQKNASEREIVLFKSSPIL